ncbi:MAG TPA: sigma-54 dependent transcriptional regulator [Nitrospiraceae bacterium]|nr:sigma-54 dependent transcriptional regulator [Nitrospiraceae bacterium]
MGNKILIVDDDPDISSGLKSRLSWLGYDTAMAMDGVEALKEIESSRPHVVLLDIELPGLSGLDLLKKLHSDCRPLSGSANGRQASPRPAVIMMTAFGTIPRAVEAIKVGAFDFITKPFEIDHLVLVIQKALEHEQLRQEVRFLRTEVDTRYRLVVGPSPKMRTVIETAERVAGTDIVTLLLGETGTGKEVLARAIHQWSARRDRPFVVINCAALPETLLENELFGHEKGAYTGAAGTQDGKVEAAQGGTLFLDEVGEMPLSLQAKFLRLLQDREFHRVGGTRLVKVDIRVLAATNKALAAEVKAGTFREDLFYRLNVVPITLPPLRHRREDIPVLVEHILAREAGRTGGLPKQLTPDAMTAVMTYKWPGNVRELENVLARAVILSDHQEIGPVQLAVGETTGEGGSFPFIGETEELPYHNLIEAYSRHLILEALNRTNGNQTKAAELLRLQRTYLTKLLRHKNIPSYSSDS